MRRGDSSTDTGCMLWLGGRLNLNDLLMDWNSQTLWRCSVIELNSNSTTTITRYADEWRFGLKNDVVAHGVSGRAMYQDGQ